MSPVSRIQFIGAVMHLDILQRQKITEQTALKFGDGPFEWGRRDCGKLVIHHIKAMGHAIQTGGTWTTLTGLMRFLRRHGGSGAACLDQWGLTRIPPAYAIVGDVVQIEDADSPTGAFGIVFGNGRVVAYMEGVESLAVVQPLPGKICAAWRV